MEQLNQEPETDMTAAEYFNGEGSPLTLDKILQPQERDFLLEHIELYAQGKVNQFKASQSHPAPEPNEVGEVYVWVKASEQNPSPEKKEHFICLIEKRGNGKVEVKLAYGYWCYSTWRVEEGWKVIEWLSIHQSHPAPVGGEKWIKVKYDCQLPIIPPPYKEDGCTITPIEVPILCHQEDSIVLDWYDGSGIMWFELKQYSHWQPLPPKP